MRLRACPPCPFFAAWRWRGALCRPFSSLPAWELWPRAGLACSAPLHKAYWQLCARQLLWASRCMAGDCRPRLFASNGRRWRMMKLGSRLLGGCVHCGCSDYGRCSYRACASLQVIMMSVACAGALALRCMLAVLAAAGVLCEQRGYARCAPCVRHVRHMECAHCAHDASSRFAPTMPHHGPCVYAGALRMCTATRWSA